MLVCTGIGRILPRGALVDFWKCSSFKLFHFESTKCPKCFKTTKIVMIICDQCCWRFGQETHYLDVSRQTHFTAFLVYAYCCNASSAVNGNTASWIKYDKINFHLKDNCLYFELKVECPHLCHNATNDVNNKEPIMWFNVITGEYQNESFQEIKHLDCKHIKSAKARDHLTRHRSVRISRGCFSAYAAWTWKVINIHSRLTATWRFIRSKAAFTCCRLEANWRCSLWRQLACKINHHLKWVMHARPHVILCNPEKEIDETQKPLMSTYTFLSKLL